MSLYTSQTEPLDLDALIAEAKHTHITREKALHILTMLELTSLNKDDSLDDIEAFCHKAETPFGNVAGVCVFPRFVETIFEALRHNTVKIVTVVNFPHGQDDADDIASTTEDVVNAGAQEVDLVLPYQAFLKGHYDQVTQALKACRQACGRHTLLKVILETSALKSKENIQNATLMAIDAGADFVKTSTGFSHEGATLETVSYILQTLHEYKTKNPRAADIGLKISGGVRTADQAAQFLKLTELIMGEDWADSYTLRFGASQLLDKLLDVIENEE